MLRHRFAPVHRSITLCVFSVTMLAAQQPTERAPQPRMDSLRALGIAHLEGGTLPTYYSPGSEERARTLQVFVEGERVFYRAKLNVPLNDLVLAVLNPQQWQPVSGPIPYGMPSVEGHPRVIVMPADWDSVTAMPLPKESDATPKLREQANASGRAWKTLIHLGADGIGAHELGHVILEDYGIDGQTHWFNEFLASYVGDVYIAEKQPQELDANRIFWKACLEWPHPHSTLAYFDAQYDELMQNDPRNYGWYQCAFDQRVIAVHAREGIKFLTKIKMAFPKGAAPLTSDQVLKKLETLDSGWKAWAALLSENKLVANDTFR
jgi:hypothetical protein